MKKIKLTQGKYALVDDEDFGFLNQWKWHCSRGYAVRKQHLRVENGKQIVKQIYMHRLINKTPEGYETDHINRNRLDNQRINLRSATRSQNAFNVGRRLNNTSGHTGVSWNRQKIAWDAYIWKNYKKINLGRFTTKLAAVHARKQAELNWMA